MTIPWTLLHGDALDVLATLPDASVQMVCTSPPYYGLRDYGTAGQIGLEASPAEYVARLVAVFGAVRRVLRDDGTVWLNLGDSYASGEVGRHDGYNPTRANGTGTAKPFGERQQRARPVGTKPKDLIGIPWRLAFALQDDGWWLRSDIIWSKPNPMPESVQGSRWTRHRVASDVPDLQHEEAGQVDPSLLRDCPGCPKCDPHGGYIFHLSAGRPTRAHEYLFLLSKRATYYYDAAAIAEPAVMTPQRRLTETHFGRKEVTGRADHNGTLGTMSEPGRQYQERNKRTVWTIATQPYAEAHFATMPEKLVEPCILAGTSERGCCAACGAPWVRVVEREGSAPQRDRYAGSGEGNGRRYARHGGFYPNEPTNERWQPGCACQAGVVPCVVLDPFVGSGTVCLVAARFNRRSIGIDLSSDYLAMAERRLMGQPMAMPL